ncbi:RNA-directed DNA polymerase, eukaryota, reverse transcriptase zinc-binding domain protein, partial [Tanacetum coccineum]
MKVRFQGWTWSINILDESLDSQTSETESDENKVDNPEVANSVDELDELIEDLNENNRHNEDIVEDINESNNEKLDNQKMEENINTQQTSSNESSSLELSRSPGFENFKKETSSTSNCSTSFARFRKKNNKGFSLINEMTRIIEVGDSLGYDVRGCRKSLTKMINGLIELPMGGRLFTYMNKAGTKLSKLDRCLLSANVIEALPDAQVIALDRLRSDHNPILFHYKKSDYGPTTFRLYHSWFNRDGFDDLISSEWNSFNQNLSSHEKLKALKAKIKVWLGGTKNSKRIHRDEMLAALKNLETNIDSNIPSLEDRKTRIKLLHEIDKIDSLEALDLHQKSQI